MVRLFPALDAEQIHIALIGMPGVGKSSVAALLGERLHVPVFDTDREIESMTGMSARQFLMGNGLDAFRNAEMVALRQILGQECPSVIAVAGGAVLNEVSGQLLARRSVAVWLRAPLEVLLERGRRSGGRVLSGTEQQVCSRLEEREPIYSSLAAIIIDTAHVSVEDVSNSIASQLNTQPPGLDG